MINSYSIFYYTDEISASNYYVDFDEGSGEISFSLTIGAYTLNELAALIQDGLNTNGSQTYTVSVDRSTRKFTISASANFSLLAATGSHAGSAVYSTIGFTTDQTGANTYTSESAIGTAYEPQFWLQDYVAKEDWSEAVNESVNESASGDVEVLSYGKVRFIQFNIRYANDYYQSPTSPIKYDASGIENLRLFMEFATTKVSFEFMPDINDRDTYIKVLLETTPQSKNGTGFKLKELYAQNLAGYYDTGILELRVIS